MTISAVDRIILRQPTATDGARLNKLVAQCPPLDPNSVYCNLLQCTHFAETSVSAELNGELSGFISAYIVPVRVDTLFVWQVAVHKNARGRGLATRMLAQLLARPACTEVTWLETTVTASNSASRALFDGLAATLGTKIQEKLLFEKVEHFAGSHESELLLRIGPITR